MKLTYRGANYEYDIPTVDMIEGEVAGKYRGQNWNYRYPRHIPNPKEYGGTNYTKKQDSQAGDRDVATASAPAAVKSSQQVWRWRKCTGRIFAIFSIVGSKQPRPRAMKDCCACLNLSGSRWPVREKPEKIKRLSRGGNRVKLNFPLLMLFVRSIVHPRSDINRRDFGRCDLF